jgi:hypothetical protein
MSPGILGRAYSPALSAISMSANVAGPRYPPAVPESISDNFYALVESGSSLTWAKLALQLLSTYPQSRSSTASQQLTSLFAESVHSLMHRTLALHLGVEMELAFANCGPRTAIPPCGAARLTNERGVLSALSVTEWRSVVAGSQVRGDDVVGEASLAGSEGGPVAGELEDSNGGVWNLNDRDTTHDRTMVIQWKGDLPHPTGVGSPAAGRLVRIVPPRCLGALARSSPGNHETAGTTRASRRRAVRT